MSATNMCPNFGSNGQVLQEVSLDNSRTNGPVANRAVREGVQLHPPLLDRKV